MPVKLPHREQESTQLNKHQAAHTDVLIKENGEVEVWSKFTNAKQLDGDHFVAVVTIFNLQDELLAVVKQVKGVNARMGGSTVEVNDYTRGTIPFWRAGGIKSIKIEHTHLDWVDDAKFWEAVKKVGDALLEEFLSNKDSGFRAVQSDN